MSSALSEAEFQAMAAEAVHMHHCPPAFRAELCRRNGPVVGMSIVLQIEQPITPKELIHRMQIRDAELRRDAKQRRVKVSRTQRMESLTTEFHYCDRLGPSECAEQAVIKMKLIE